MIAVTFTEGGQKTLDGFGFPAGFQLLNQGFDVLAVKTLSEQWYSDIPTTLLDSLLDVLSGQKYAHRAGLGSSNGGYAAILLSGRLSFNSVLAISPQFDVTQHWDRRWSDKVRRLTCMRLVARADIASECRFAFAYDPYDLDRLHVDLFKAIIRPENFTDVRVPHAGHPAGFMLNDVSALKSLVVATLSGDNISPALARKIRKGRARSKLYLLNLGRHLLEKKKTKWAKSAISGALEVDPLDFEIHMVMAKILELEGDLRSAVLHAALASALSPEHADMAAGLARLLCRVGRREPAAFFINRAVQLSDNLKYYIDQRDRMEL